MDHKITREGQFLETKIYTSPESEINKLSIGLWFDRTLFGRDKNHLIIWNLRVQNNQNTEKVTFKVVKVHFSSMHITNKTFIFFLY